MTDFDWRYVYWGGYGLGLLIVYGLLLRRRVQHFRKHRDPRAFRDARFALGLFLVAVAASLAITWALFGPKGTGIGGILSALASAAFLIVGIDALGERQPANGGHAARRQ